MPFRLLVLALLALAGCQPARAPGPTPSAPAPAPTLQPPVATDGPVAPSPAPSPAVRQPSPSPSPAACSFGKSQKLATLQDRTIAEASALVASWRTPDLYWTLNDSGNTPHLYAFDVTGRSVAKELVGDARNVDW